MKTTTSLDDVVARLKAEQELAANEEHQEGRKHGDEWARNAPLRLLRRFGRTFKTESVADVLGGYDDVARGLAYDISGEGEIGPVDFWGLDVSDELDGITYDYARGFCEAVLDVWDAVKDQL